MRARGGDGKARAIGRGAELAAHAQHLVLQLLHVGADRRADLDDRLVHLPLDVVAE